MAKANSKKVIIAALVGNALIAVTKFFAAAITNSSAMLTEGIHSLVDTGNQVLLLYGMRQSRKPADANYPFGHGKEIYFWSFVVAIMIFAVGAGVSIYEGSHRLSDPQPITSPMTNYIVLVLAMVFEGFAWYFAFREFNRVRGKQGYFEAVHSGKDPTLFVVLFEDSAAMLGLMVAFAGVALGQITGNPVWDGIAAICIGIILGITAIWLAVETKGLLIGEAARPDIVRNIEKFAVEHAGVGKVNEVLTMHIGPEYVLVNLSIEFADDLLADDLERTIDSLDRGIKQANPLVKRIFIEAEAAAARA